MQNVAARAATRMVLESPGPSRAVAIKAAAGKKPDFGTYRERQPIPFYRAIGNGHAIAAWQAGTCPSARLEQRGAVRTANRRSAWVANFWSWVSKTGQPAKNDQARMPADSQHVPPAWGEKMHGGMNFLDGPAERFQRQAQDYLKLATEANDPEHQRLWYDLALDCLRIAATVREPAR
jgi:hypothetical protein